MDVVTLGVAKAYAGKRMTAGGAATVGLGDSITQGGSVGADHTYATTWLTYMALASQGRMRLIRNSGIGGNHSSDMLARFQTDVLAHNPSVVLITSGTNDLDIAGDTLACVETMIQRALAANIRVGLLTLPPRGTPPLVSPTDVVATGLTGGTLPAGTWDYAVVSDANPGKPAAFTPVTVVTTTVGTVRLTWTAIRNTARYWFYRRTSGVGLFEFVGGVGPGFGRPSIEPYFDDTGLTQTPGVNPGAAEVVGSGNYSGRTIDATQHAKIAGAVAVYERLAAKYGLPLVNQHRALVDLATGTYQAGRSSDGVHPVDSTLKVLGQGAWTALADMFPAWAPSLTTDPYHVGDMIPPTQNNNVTPGQVTNGGLLPAPGALPWAGVPQHWANYGTTNATVVLDVEAGTPGNVLTITTTTPGEQKFVSLQLTNADTVSTYATGDRIRFALKLKATGLDVCGGLAQFSVAWTGRTSGAAYLTNVTVRSDVTGWSIWTAEDAVPPGTTSIDFQAQLIGLGAQLKLAQLTMLNLTRMGIAS